MTTLKIRELKAKRTKLGADAKAIMEAALGAGRNMNGEEEKQFDALMDQRDQTDGMIERAEKLLDDDRDAVDDLPDDQRGKGQDDAQLKAFRSYLVHGRSALTDQQVRALNMGTDPEGGFLMAPQQFVQELLQAVDDMVAIRRLGTVQQLTTAESLGVPTLDTDLSDADWTSELSTGSQDDNLRFGKRELRPNPIAKQVKVSRTLLRRAALSPEAIVRQRMEYKFGVTQEKAFMTGDGNKKPLGLFTASADGIPTSRDVATGSATGFTGDGLIDAKYSLKSQYWAKARWLFHRDGLRIVRKLKDDNGQYLWQPGLASDRPDTILDAPYEVNEYVPNTFTNGNYVGMFGDFSFYWIVDSLQMDVQRLVELYATSNQVGFIGRMESDGMPVMPEAFVRLKAATS
ncbi:phage major capsid protein [Streptomyces sp. NPDC051014]|uniref:phage major capsid protein n=1 Tax=Streptomyces sp. NPDC051014 TaxID=3155751 RepID=UPI0033DA2E8D